MVNLGLNVSASLGILQILISVITLILIRRFLTRRNQPLSEVSLILHSIQAILVILLLIPGGLVLLFQGWRLDPIVGFSQFLITISLVYMLVKDWIIHLWGHPK